MYQILIVVFLAIAILLGFSTKSSGNRENPPDGAGRTDEVKLAAGAGISEARAKMKERLEKLAASEAPKIQPKPMATCYAPMPMPQGTVEWICNDCRTVNSFSKPTADSIKGVRNMVGRVRQAGLDITLLEGRLCKKCNTSGPAPETVVRVKYSSDADAVENHITAFDLQVLLDFMNGRDRVDMGYGQEQPMKNYIGTLEKLLGVKIEKKGK